MLLGTLQCTGHPRTQSPTSAQAEKRGWEHGPGGGPGPTCVTAAASPPVRSLGWSLLIDTSIQARFEGTAVQAPGDWAAQAPSFIRFQK